MSGCLVTADDVFVWRGAEVKSWRNRPGTVGVTPFPINQYLLINGQPHFLATNGDYYQGVILVASGVRQINNYYYLLANGQVYRHTKELVPLAQPIARLVDRLFITANGALIDRRERVFAPLVLDASCSGEIVAYLLPNGVIELNDIIESLDNMLVVPTARKIVLHEGTLLVLTANGELVVGGNNDYCENGQPDTPALLPTRLPFPEPIIDFDYRAAQGWARSVTDRYYVWGYNDSGATFTELAPDQFILPPTLLPL